MFEEGFSTSTVFDTKNQEFLNRKEYFYIKKIEIYHLDDGILGFFPFFGDRGSDKKIMENSYYNQFISKMKDIKNKLKDSKKEFKKEIIELTEPLLNIKVVYDRDLQRIKSIKFSSQNQSISIGSQNIDKKEFSLLYKKNCFISGMKTTYLNTANGIQYLSYVKCYFGRFDEMYKYNIFQKKLKEPNFCNKLVFFPFKLIKFSIKSIIYIFESLIKTLLVLFLIISPPVFLYWKSQNFYTGTFELSSLNTNYELKNNDKIKIFTDKYGFPHIKANNLEDAYFGLGFAQAKNRLWQIDMNRRIARGTLSEIFGNKTLETDKFMRGIGHNEYAIKQSLYVEENSEYINLIKAFIEGINYFGNNFKLPVEYYISLSEFNNFTLPDMIATISLFGMSMSQDYAMEVWYEYMEKILGKKMAQKIASFRDVGYPFWDTTIVSDDELKKLGLFRIKEDKKIEGEEYYTVTENEKNKNINKEKTENINDSIIGDKLKNDGASNCWNVDGNFTFSGKPLLCNDPHLPNGMPGMLFIAKMYLPDNILSGACLPGTPIFITGSNSFISWGITTENTDNSDFCEELIQGDYYIKDNIKYPLEITKETIYIKGNLSTEIEIKKTKNGPIIGKTVPSALTLLNEPYTNSLPLSLRVAYMKKKFTSFNFFFRINFAHSQHDFLPFKQMLTFPNINLHWITKDGEIGWDAIGIITLKNYYNRFCHGYVSEDDIIKEVPIKEMLHKYNPQKGYIVSANNKPASENYLYELRGHHNNFRAHRIEEILENLKKNGKKLFVGDAINILNDVKDTNAEYILPKYLELIEKHSKNMYKLKNNKYYSLLKSWNYEMNFDSLGATVYSVLERQIGAQLLRNEYKTNETYIESPILNYLFYWNYVSGLIDKIYKGEKIKMPECRTFNGYSYEEDCEKFIVKIFDNLDQYMESFKNKNGSIKKWGEINFNYFPHTTFDKLPILNKLFNKKKFVGGNRNTVKIVRGPVNHKEGKFVGTQSPRLKFVCDMDNPETPYITVSEGNGGNFVQEFYNNFDEKHENAKLVKFENINFENIENQNRIITFTKKLI
jgi:penicillin amidase